MDDELENIGGTTGSGEGVVEALSAISDAVGDLVTGIPAPIRKNALKAFARLCTAVVEYPVALIENVIAEKQAESRARIKLIDTSADQIAEQMRTDPEYARAAATKFAHKIIRERINVDLISEIAAVELKSAPVETGPQESLEPAAISDDWLNAFEAEAAQMSSQEMQDLFGKILAGEIRRPKSYSIKTIKVIAQLDNQAAALFKRLCSLSISFRISDTIVDARVASFGNAASNTLAEYGLTFDALNVLQEYGLIISDYNSFMDYRFAVVTKGGRAPLAITYQDSKWVLTPNAEFSMRQVLSIHGVAFSRCGKELLPIVDVEADAGYTAALGTFFDQRKLVFTKIERSRE